MRWLSSPWKIVVLLAPTAILFTAFVVYPVGYSIFFSFTEFSGFGAAEYVGADNYIALVNEPLFWLSLRNTGILVAASLLIIIPVSFLLALLLRQRFAGAAMLRALLFAPGILAPILVGLVWVFILSPSVGLLNGVLGSVGAPQPAWIGSEVIAPFSVAIVFLWSTVGFAMTIFYAGLQSLPTDVEEASALDGASAWQRVRYITIPMMRETFAITTVLVITNALKVFEIVYQLTSGGPIHKSEVLVSYMYFITFRSQEYGKGMAFAVIIAFLGALVSVGYIILLRRRQEARG